MRVEASPAFAIVLLSIVGAACAADGPVGGPASMTRAPLSERAANPTCLAPPRPSGGTGVRVERAFPRVAPTLPVALVQPPGSDRWVLAERSGRVLTFPNRDDATARTWADLRDRVDDSAQETGLLGLAFHPAFERNGFVFVSYVTRVGGRWQSRISRFEGDASGLRGSSERVVLTLDQPYDNHNGGHIAFGPDGYLYAAFGDGGAAGDPNRRAGDRGNLFGTILRIDVDSLPYRIPSDNPFVGEGGRAEIWAYGLRNPWRFTFDRETGELWAGDVGQDRREEINRVVRGGDHGWSELEGSLCFRPGCSPAGTVLPVAEYGRDEGVSVTGGYVYRGDAIPALRGTYLYADFGTGTMWGLFPDASGTLAPQRLASTGIAPSSFAEGDDGELYLLDYGVPGGLYRLVPDGAPQRDLPERLSETGCFDPADPRQPLEALVPYEVNAPLWSDGAEKHRWAAIPDGTRARFEGDRVVLPVGSVLVKEFELDGRRLETRLLVRHADGDWAGYTYVWNDEGSDAFLARGSERIEVDGARWTVPSRGQCLQCHTTAAGRTLGFRTDQLDRVVRYGDGRFENQLDALRRVGWLEGNPASRPEPLVEPEGEASFEERARSYLDANCSGCHRPGGTGRGALDLRYEAPFPEQGLCDETPALGDLGIPDARLFAPGDPERSVLLARMSTRGPGQMPPLGTHRVDPSGTGLVRDWIRETTACAGRDWQRTVVFLRRETQPGQDIFLRGGIDHDRARERLGVDCGSDPTRCTVPIRHRVPGRGTGDTRLDWYGPEPGQARDTVGTPLVWTTDRWPAAWGPTRRVGTDGYGETPLNRYGPHYWMLDVDVDCARTVDGWFELKAFVTNGPGWEPNISQEGAPYGSINHFARCGEVTVLSWGSGTVGFGEVPR